MKFPNLIALFLVPTAMAIVAQDTPKPAAAAALPEIPPAPGRISSIVNIHNPSIEMHAVEGSLNTGAAIILAAGGGHNTLNFGTEGADFVPYFFPVFVSQPPPRTGRGSGDPGSATRPAANPAGTAPQSKVPRNP